MRLYEGFVLIDSMQANRGLEQIMDDIAKLLEKHGGVVIRSGVWGERKLAYEIQGARRGTYLLYYFKMDPLKIDDFKRDFKLYEKALRIMIIREDRSEEEILGQDSLSDQSAATPEQKEKTSSSAEETVEDKDKASEDAEETGEEETPSPSEEDKEALPQT
ncbi:MAG: 30S ribosomal protein S6 [Planctomycetota bacterium]|nr:MAG: 30S ribosomal protein S6 [Planctomycetota bacterium]